MLKISFVTALLLLSLAGFSQESLTISGGAVIARAIDYSGAFNKDYQSEANGFRITTTYEIGAMENKKFVHGLTTSYILSKSTINEYNEHADISVQTIPFCYAPKFLIGTENLLAFARAAVGMQFTRIQVGGTIDDSDTDFGFYGGIGFGGMAYVSKRVFFNLEYELAYMSNTYYANGYINSVQLGLGIDF